MRFQNGFLFLVKATTWGAVFALIVSTTIPAQAKNKEQTPTKIFNELIDDIYTISEVSGSQKGYDKAMSEAVASFRTLISRSRDVTTLLGPDEDGRTPLLVAAQYGYAPIIDELLKHQPTLDHIDTKDKNGMTAWDYSMLATRQSIFACNPNIFNFPTRFVPYFVTQAYYGPRNPYPKIRHTLEQAGAHADMEEAREHWQSLCKFQSDYTRNKIKTATDVQAMAIEEGEATLSLYIANAQARKGRR